MEKPERRLIIIGDGETREEDFVLATSTKSYFEIMIVNKVIKYGYNYNHWVSYHPEVFMLRTAWEGLTHSNNTRFFRPDVIWKHINEGGTSSLFALEIALKLGYNKIVLCGCPLSGEYGHDTVIYPWKVKIGRRAEVYREKVRSFSGRTLDLLGDARGWW